MNVFDVELQWDEGDPDGYHVGYKRLGPDLGAEQLGMSVYELPPGMSVCPYHWEAGCDEWLFVFRGRPTLRTPEGERTVEPGDTVCFPEGPDGAHHVRNGTDELVRVALLSTKSAVGIAEYPDSDKVGVWPGGGKNYMLRRSEHLEYWDGER